MNTSSRMLAACVGTSLAMITGSAWADPATTTLQAWHGLAAVGQANPTVRSPEEARRQVDDLLRKARQAMKDGNMQTADSLISRAENIPATFGVMHMGDTPKKARRDFNRMQGAKAPQKPSDLFAPDGKEKPAKTGAAVRDPFAKQSNGFEPTMDRPAADTGMAVDAQVIDAPPESDNLGKLPGEKGFPTDSPFGKGVMTSPPGDDGREPGLPVGNEAPVRQTADELVRDESNKLLFASRRALAVGDMRRANELLSQAKTLNLQYDFQEDSPAKVEAVIQHFAQVMQQGGSPDSEAFRRRKAESLLEQSEGLLGWKDFDEAERLAESARRLNVVFGPADANPETLLDRIAAARRGGAARVEHLPPVERAAPSRYADYSPDALNPDAQQKEQALRLVSQAKAALAAGDLDRAEEAAQAAESLGVPDTAFSQNDERPWQVLLKVQRLRQEQRKVRPAAGVTPIATDEKAGPTASQAIYDRDNDPTRNVPAGAQNAIEAGAMELFQRGEQALRDHDRATALNWFRQANLHRDELDPVTKQRLQDHLQFLARPEPVRTPGTDGSLLNETAATQQLKYRQIAAELARKEQSSAKLRETSPKQARQALEEGRSLVEKADLDKPAKDILLRRVDRQLEDLEKFVNANRGRIELNERNDEVRGKIERERATKVEVQEKLAELVDEFNTLMREKRYAEAEVIYKRAAEIAPDELVVLQLKNMWKMVSREQKYQEIANAKEQYFVDSLNGVERSSAGIDDSKPYQFGDAKDWVRLTKSRKDLENELRNRKTERDVEIDKKLQTPVWLKFQEAPLAQVIEDLGKLAQIPTHLDQRGLTEEGVDTNTPVTINLTREISLKSALHLILEPLHLSYVIKDEVLKITSEQMRDGEVVKRIYNVADLVVPIPNFVPNPYTGLAGALHTAQANLPNNWAGLNGDAPMPVAATATGEGANAMFDPKSMLAQMGAASASAIAPVSATSLAGGPGGLGGGTMADFESLIELITSTVAPTTWDDVGGPGTVQQFQGNLSLVISQTQEVHEEIADLLEQLRRLQDLQVTIEVRFITLNDNFFERIGINFDFEIPTRLNKPFALFGQSLGEQNVPNTGTTTAFPVQTNTQQNVGLPANGLTTQESVTAGLAPGSTGSVLYSSNLDIPFQQGSFGLATPQFGGYQAGAGATVGFAILSNIEAFFLIEASQGDRRSNVLQAPKVTLFNGQSATIADVTQTPFVISVIPVVGAFAAAQQPVIIVLNEGTSLSVQAVISSDRRFVRLTLIPFFSNITAVNTFTFSGSSTTTQNSDSEGPSDNTTKRITSQTTSSEGTTVQLPSFSFFTVNTTVSVPDGGTVLLGGIKRLNEGRNEFGVPILSKIPYLNRLFKNIGIGRETQSLMMMVTPRIIIQEEEEALLGIPSTP